MLFGGYQTRSYCLNADAATGEWISNGHWLVRLDCTNLKSESDPKFQKFISSTRWGSARHGHGYRLDMIRTLPRVREQLKKWLVTEETAPNTQHGGLIRRLVSDQGNAALNDFYLSGLGLRPGDTLLSSAWDRIFVDAVYPETTRGIMPMRGPW